jgi:tetratricopeptide (TPR) repeat protein
MRRNNIHIKLKRGFSKFGFFKLIIPVVLFVLIFTSCGVLKGKSGKNEDPRIKNFQFNYHFLEGNKQKILGNYEEALKQYSFAYQVDETQAAVCYEIAGILNLGGDINAAMEYAKKAVALDNTENEYYKLLLAYLYQNNLQIQKAAEVYKTLIKTHPEQINYYFELSGILMELGDLKEAIKILDNAETRFGVNEMISLEKESCYSTSGRYDEAIGEVQKLVDNSPENEKCKTLLAESYVNAGKYIEADQVYQSINLEQIEDGIVYFSMADFYRTRQDYESSIKYLALGIKRDDVELDIKVRIMLQMLEIMGDNNFLIGNMKYMLEVFTEMYPDELKVRALNSDFFLMTKDYEAAQKEFDFLLEHDKSRYKIWGQALQLDFVLNDMQSMYKRSKEATQLFPNVIELYRYFIISAYSTENYSEVCDAVGYVSSFLRNDQQLLTEFLILQGDSYHKSNMHHESDSVYEIVLDKDAENLTVLNNYSYFLVQRGENLNRALELSTKLMELDSDNPVYLDTHAWVLYENKKYEEAISFIKKAILNDKQNDVYYNHQGDILFKLGEIDKAVKSWEKAVEYGDDSEQLKEKIRNKTIVD